MKNLLFIALGLLTLSSCTELTSVLEDVVTIEDVAETSALSNEEVIAGLKQALDKGAELAVGETSKVDGFFKNDLLFIAFPEDAIKVKEKALEFGLDNQVEKFEMTLNRAAENACAEALPIFIDAVAGMSIQDGFAILNGADNAATAYLKDKTSSQLTAAFSPVIDQAIEDVELTKFWEPLISNYNTVTILTGGEEINPDLNSYINDKAMDGLFHYIEIEEKNIRENPQARVTELLERVFGSLGN